MVFAVLAREVVSLVFQEPEAFERQADLHRLRMVCKDFKAICETQLVLSSTLILPLGLTSKSLDSLLSWAREHASSVRFLVGGDGFPYQQHVPLTCTWAALCCCHNSLAPPVISNFTSLTSCKISTADGHNIDLIPLCTSSILQELHLQSGEYTISTLPPHLTQLSLMDAASVTTKACLHVTSMRRLHVCDSHLDMGSWGVFAYSDLQDFTCHCSYVADRSMVVDTSADCHIVIPKDLTPISDITVLSIHFGTAPKPGLDLDCFSALTALRDLNVYASDGNVLITPSLTALQQLTCLSITARLEARRGPPRSRAGRIEADIQWQYMQSLRYISIECDVFHFRRDVMTLLKLRSLAYISLGERTHFMPSDYMSSGFFGSLLLHLAQQRPDVGVTLNWDYDCMEPSIADD